MKAKRKVSKLYVVRCDDTCRLVSAISASAALRHVVHPKYIVFLAKAGDVAEAMSMGAKVEESVAEQEAEAHEADADEDEAESGE